MKPRIEPILAIIAGILVIVFPDILAWIVGLYLILSGISRMLK